MIFLGTAAAECGPNPFCTCEYCERARTTDDPREKRRRSAFLLDDENIVDFGPDVMAASGVYKKNLSGLKRIFLTHSHEDHFSYSNMAFLSMAVTKPPRPVLYLSKEAHAGIKEIIESVRGGSQKNITVQIERNESAYDTQIVVPFTEYVLDGETTMFAVKGRHNSFMNDELSLNYLFKRNGLKLFYALDTGRFFEETYEALAGENIDILIIEGTFGLKKLPQGAGHLDFYSLCEELETLYKKSIIGEKTNIYITHIAHHAQMGHNEYENRLRERFGQKVSLAYDGLEI
jgi:phosphoribosyl 1,2-cyclic phosphate phosphodiesterase